MPGLPEPIATMTSAVLRHAAPLLNIRAPIIAGVGAAILFAVAVGALSLFGETDQNPPSARGGVEPLPVEEYQTADLRGDTADPSAGIRFVDDAPGEEASLSGVNEGFDPPPATPASSAGSDPAAAEAALQAEVAAANSDALPRAPLAGLFEPGPGGPLPIIAANGARPSRAYARPYHGDPSAPTIAVVVGGLGLNATVTEAAINDLPPEVALSFAAYTPNLQTWIDRAREAGHEVLIEAPMEPFDYPNSDSGPHTLLADGSPEENQRRLAWVLSRASGYFGVTNYLGARFSSSEPAMTALLNSLEARGVAFLHDGAGRRSTVHSAARTADVTYAISDRIVDENPSPAAIDNQLLALEALALQNGASLGSGFAYPATVEQLQLWASGLQARGYQLAPPSAVMARRRLESRIESETASAPARNPARPASDTHTSSSADDDGHH